jgi:hypothetical protein
MAEFTTTHARNNPPASKCGPTNVRSFVKSPALGRLVPCPVRKNPTQVSGRVHAVERRNTHKHGGEDVGQRAARVEEGMELHEVRGGERRRYRRPQLLLQLWVCTAAQPPPVSDAHVWTDSSGPATPRTGIHTADWPQAPHPVASINGATVGTVCRDGAKIHSQQESGKGACEPQRGSWQWRQRSLLQA